jgi:hypothetical protein
MHIGLHENMSFKVQGRKAASVLSSSVHSSTLSRVEELVPGLLTPD